MAKRDEAKAAIRKEIASLSTQLKALLPTVLGDTGIESKLSLHGKIGQKNEHFIDVRNALIYSPEQFLSEWLEGLEDHISKQSSYFRNPANSYYHLYHLIKRSTSFREYLRIFLRRTYLNHYEAYTRHKPRVEESEIWIGQNHADFGLLVTPRFANEQWENDKSEIRHFGPKYFSIGHVLKTGLVVPSKNRTISFHSVEEYLTFFQEVLVRLNKSQYGNQIAEMYREFVLNHDNQLEIPLLIPEFRYNGMAAKHEHRLDFLIIDSANMNKVGFELSPWSTHGQIKNITKEKKTQVAINAEAQENWENEVNKLKKYYKAHGIVVLIYSDRDLKGLDVVFEDMKKYLEPKKIGVQLEIDAFRSILQSSF